MSGSPRLQRQHNVENEQFSPSVQTTSPKPVLPLQQQQIHSSHYNLSTIEECVSSGYTDHRYVVQDQIPEHGSRQQMMNRSMSQNQSLIDQLEQVPVQDNTKWNNLIKVQSAKLDEVKAIQDETVKILNMCSQKGPRVNLRGAMTFSTMQ